MESAVSHLKIERIKKGLTQAELAKQIGVGLSSITRWEKNNDTMPVSKLRELVELFGCSADYLVVQEVSE